MANAHRRDRVGVTGWNVGVRGEAVEEAPGGRDSPTMPLSAIALVLLSALLHASWNLLLKRAGGTQEVVALSKIVEVVLFAPVFVWGFAADLPEAATVAWFTAVAATGVGLNYLFLARAYRHGELSVVYPISRGAILAFLPVAGWFALGERVAPLGVAGLLAIVCGILVLNLPEWSRSAVRGLATSLRGRATLYSIAAGFVAAGYTVWDKRAVAVMAPFAYMYLYTVLVALGYGVWLATRVASGATRQAWRAHAPSIVGIGAMNTASYLLILLALRTGVTSYVLGMRQVSIAVGVWMGWALLRERMSGPRLAGVVLIVAGCLAVTLVAGR